ARAAVALWGWPTRFRYAQVAADPFPDCRDRSGAARAMLYASEHPLVRLKVAELRDAQTRPPRFRELVREIALLLGYEALRDLPLATRTVRTPLTEAEGH